MLLIDTHIFLWAAEDPKKLPKKAKELLLDPSTQLFVSAASIWEISIKISLGRLKFPIKETSDVLESLGAKFLPIEINDFEILIDLPQFHKDPFDRLIIAQALRSGAKVLTADAAFKKYKDCDLILV